MRSHDLNFPCSICSNEVHVLLYEKKGFPIVRCIGCGIVTTVLPKDFNTSLIYDDSYFNGGQVDGYADYPSSEKILHAEFRSVVKKLCSYFTDTGGKKLLEIGSAYGYFLDEAVHHFESYGVEINTGGVRESRQRGLNVFEGEINDAILAKTGTLDVVVMLDVIEHLKDPLQTIQKLYNHMNPGGIILIVTGNHDSMLSRTMKANWRLMTPPQHTFYFSAKTLSALVRKAGFKISAVDAPWKLVPLGLPFYQVGRRVGFRLKTLEKMNGVGIPVNLFDTVRVIAYK